MEKRFISWLQQPETTERGGGTKLARRGINPFNNKVYKKIKKLIKEYHPQPFISQTLMPRNKHQSSYGFIR